MHWWPVAGILLGVLACLVWVPLVLHAEGNAGLGAGASGIVGAGWGPFGFRVRGGEEPSEVWLLLFGRRVLRFPLPKSAEGKKSDAEDKKKSPRKKRKSRRQIPVRFLLGQRKHVHLESLRGGLTLGFEDMALTGQVYGYLWSLRGALPQATQEFEHHADWSGQTSLLAHGQVALRIYVGRIALATAAEMARTRIPRRPPAQSAFSLGKWRP